MRRRRVQVTCWCRAYSFPHRITGGRCNGREWAESYHLFERYACACCNLNNNGHCEVALGQERLAQCDGYRDTLRGRVFNLRHPVDLEQMLMAGDGREPGEIELEQIPF